MKITTFLFALGALGAVASALTPNPSNTHMNINTAPRIAISRSGSISKLDTRASVDSILDKHATLQYLSNAIRDASAEVLRTRSIMNGISRRTHVESSAGLTKEQKKARRTMTTVQTADGVRMRLSRSGMGKTSQPRTRSTNKERQKPKVLPTSL